MAQWFVARDGKQQGPVSQEGLVQAIARGKVRASDLVWNETLPAWVAVSDIPELAMALPGQPATTQGTAAAAAQAADDAPAEAAPEPTHAEAADPAPVTQLGYQSSINRGSAIVFTDRAVDMLRQTRPWVLLISVLLFVVVGFGFVGLVFALVAQLSLTGASGPAALYLVTTGVQALVLLLYVVPALYLWRYGSRIGQFVSARREDLAEQALEAQKSFWKFVGIVTLVSIIVALVMVAVAVLIAAGALR